MQYQLKENFRISSADADFQRKLKVSSLINMFIQIAWKHAEDMGYGVKSMDDSGLAWMLSRLHIKIEYLPAWNEILKLSTWPKGIRRLFYLRDFLVKNENDELLAKSTSEWLMIDINTRRPKLKDADKEGFNINKDQHALDNEVPYLESLDDTNETFKFTPRYSDLDLNQHLTATKYIDWMMDTFDLAFLENHKCSELMLNFMHEITFSENIIVKRKINPKNQSYHFEFSSEVKKDISFRGIIFFKSN